MVNRNSISKNIVPFLSSNQHVFVFRKLYKCDKDTLKQALCIFLNNAREVRKEMRGVFPKHDSSIFINFENLGNFSTKNKICASQFINNSHFISLNRTIQKNLHTSTGRYEVMKQRIGIGLFTANRLCNKHNIFVNTTKTLQRTNGVVILIIIAL